ncbi:hypothetical protein HPB48_022176 [Haemaphysalis longicornis]|uniref:Uncharacterized protein n=1 Tax=Haemaphysalis longicornis TaxID=44386 RepID=A0A9J6FBR7_HAELO|nr:hypothetical protein HPB48_022176 [Haemaphysalis longicornis]
MNAKIAALEAMLALPENSQGPSENALLKVSERLTEITSRCDDAENRQRSSNLIFFAIDDRDTEEWDEAAEKIITFCSERLEVETASQQFERVHRLGKFTEDLTEKKELCTSEVCKEIGEHILN